MSGNSGGSSSRKSSKASYSYFGRGREDFGSTFLMTGAG